MRKNDISPEIILSHFQDIAKEIFKKSQKVQINKTNYFQEFYNPAIDSEAYEKIKQQSKKSSLAPEAELKIKFGEQLKEALRGDDNLSAFALAVKAFFSAMKYESSWPKHLQPDTDYFAIELCYLFLPGTYRNCSTKEGYLFTSLRKAIHEGLSLDVNDKKIDRKGNEITTAELIINNIGYENVKIFIAELKEHKSDFKIDLVLKFIKEGIIYDECNLYLAPLEEDEILNEGAKDQAKKNQTPILIKKPNGSFSTYGNPKGEEWEEVNLVATQEEVKKYKSKGLRVEKITSEELEILTEFWSKNNKGKRSEINESLIQKIDSTSLLNILKKSHSYADVAFQLLLDIIRFHKPELLKELNIKAFKDKYLRKKSPNYEVVKKINKEFIESMEEFYRDLLKKILALKIWQEISKDKKCKYSGNEGFILYEENNKIAKENPHYKVLKSIEKKNTKKYLKEIFAQFNQQMQKRANEICKNLIKHSRELYIETEGHFEELKDYLAKCPLDYDEKYVRHLSALLDKWLGEGKVEGIIERMVAHIEYGEEDIKKIETIKTALELIKKFMTVIDEEKSPSNMTKIDEKFNNIKSEIKSINEINIFLFNLNIDTLDKYDFALMSDKDLKTDLIEFKCEQEGFKYRVIGLDGQEKTGLILWGHLPENFPQKDAEILAKKSSLLPEILKKMSNFEKLKELLIKSLINILIDIKYQLEKCFAYTSNEDFKKINSILKEIKRVYVEKNISLSSLQGFEEINMQLEETISKTEENLIDEFATNRANRLKEIITELKKDIQSVQESLNSIKFKYRTPKEFNFNQYEHIIEKRKIGFQIEIFDRFEQYLVGPKNGRSCLTTYFKQDKPYKKKKSSKKLKLEMTNSSTEVGNVNNLGGENNTNNQGQKVENKNGEKSKLRTSMTSRTSVLGYFGPTIQDNEIRISSSNNNSSNKKPG